MGSKGGRLGDRSASLSPARCNSLGSWTDAVLDSTRVSKPPERLTVVTGSGASLSQTALKPGQFVPLGGCGAGTTLIFDAKDAKPLAAADLTPCAAAAVAGGAGAQFSVPSERGWAKNKRFVLGLRQTSQAAQTAAAARQQAAAGLERAGLVGCGAIALAATFARSASFVAFVAIATALVLQKMWKTALLQAPELAVPALELCALEETPEEGAGAGGAREGGAEASPWMKDVQEGVLEKFEAFGGDMQKVVL